MMLHPCFYNSTRAEREASQGHPIPTTYFSARSMQQPFEVSGIVSPAAVTVWLRPLEAYASLLFDNGFVITGLAEPHPTREQIAAEPWWAENFKRPLFLLITAERTSAATTPTPR